MHTNDTTIDRSRQLIEQPVICRRCGKYMAVTNLGFCICVDCPYDEAVRLPEPCPECTSRNVVFRPWVGGDQAICICCGHHWSPDRQAARGTD